jgi:DNA-binding NarL/FixJ family response regulator
MENTTPLSAPTDPLPNPALTDFTKREWQALLEAGNDLTNAEIADRLALEVKSVENYRSKIKDKLNLEGPRCLDRFARQHKPVLQLWYAFLHGKKRPPPF